MRYKKLAFLVCWVMLSCSFAIAQTPSSDAAADKAKKKKELDELVVQMLDQTIADANGLRLPENRAVVYSIAGDLYWKYDDKRSRELFRNSAAELVNYNFETEKEIRDNPRATGLELPDPGNLRGQVLPLVAKHDPELALELLVQTRPIRLAEAMQKALQPAAKMPGDVTVSDPMTQRVSQETGLEQQFALLAADADPDKAIAMIKESLAKGVSFSVIPLLQKLYKKDEKKAVDLAAEVIRKLLDMDLAKNQQEMRVALSFLQFGSRPVSPSAQKEKQFAFSDSQLKDVANRMFNALLQMPNSSPVTQLISQAIPVLEKFVPERIGVLKQRQAEYQRSLPADIRSAQQRQQLWSPSSSAEDILAQIPKMQSQADRTNAYQAVAAKIGQINDDARAKRLIDQIGDDKARAAAQEQFDSARLVRAVMAGKLDEARQLIGTLTNKRIQIQSLVAMAMQTNKKGGEKNIETARSLMKDARSLANETPEDGEDITDLMEVVKGYAVVEPDIAFRLFETMLDPLNEYVQATAVLSRYDKRFQEFRKGELVMRVSGTPGGQQLLFRYIPQMQLLGKADLERMSLLADRFARSDSRMIVKLYVLQGFLRDDPRPAAPVM